MLRDQLAGIAVSIEVMPESLEVFADPNLLDQVILNLVKNAIDALAKLAEPSVSLSAGLDYGRALIRVRDNGPGIPAEDMDQIFVPFFTTKRDGSGIGLSLSRQIMTAHGGDIAVESDATGTTVSLLF